MQFQLQTSTININICAMVLTSEMPLLSVANTQCFGLLECVYTQWSTMCKIKWHRTNGSIETKNLKWNRKVWPARITWYFQICRFALHLNEIGLWAGLGFSAGWRRAWINCLIYSGNVNLWHTTRINKTHTLFAISSALQMSSCAGQDASHRIYRMASYNNNNNNSNNRRKKHIKFHANFRFHIEIGQSWNGILKVICSTHIEIEIESVKWNEKAFRFDIIDGKWSEKSNHRLQDCNVS